MTLWLINTRYSLQSLFNKLQKQYNEYWILLKHINWWPAAVLSTEPISAWFSISYKLTSDTVQHKTQPPEFIQQITANILNISKHLNWWPAAVLSAEPISAWFWYKLTSDIDLQSLFNKLQWIYIFNTSKHLNWWSGAVLSTEPVSAWFWYNYKLTSDTDLQSLFNKLQSCIPYIYTEYF